MIPVHTHWLNQQHKTSQSDHKRARYLSKLQNLYGRLLVKSFRVPALTLGLLLGAFASAVFMIGTGQIKTNFFASDPLKVFYVNVEMPAGTPLEQTLDTTLAVEKLIRKWLDQDEPRALVSYAGQMFTQTEPRVGDVYGQVFVSLNAKTQSGRSVDDIIDGLRHAIKDAPSAAQVSILRMAGGPPSSKPISIKVRGEDYATIRVAVEQLKDIMGNIAGIKDINDDAALGSSQIITRLDMSAIRQAGLDPVSLIRSLRVLTDGEVIAQLTDQGEKVDLRIRANTQQVTDLDAWLSTPIALPTGGSTPLSALIQVETASGYASLRHHNYRRAITVEADLDKTQLDTLAANTAIKTAWKQVSAEHTGIHLDFSGELDELNESLGSIGMLFLIGIGLMYLLLGAQFQSYSQPLLILLSVPMAFTGVVYGLWFNDLSLSLYTLYGVVALSGIAVNSAIVLISAANDRQRAGMSSLHATVYAARRRLVPILITSITTMVGLAGLAFGMGGQSLMFTPVAVAIFWGIMISSLLTLFTIPLLYRWLAGRKEK
jgi:multidrug efflux pump subunit AcrB